uniref:Predicted nuclease of the RNAse H fold, HicB family n=1 Tax=Candidatus Kentrum sp. LPFa TaxID=2126335 RepID=A0A450XC26_9GAMM|nr:MAG: Predicted nuclease of the RNAse H fold, HicB family [Candidatus Kentron sp. LPFa]VFK26843.1 MAG: Predicted nuclease of the RNAse H fold, HicB family [Candidatus Kentron sp. LPFa]
MNTMSHKGYVARIEYDERDGIFVGRVLGIRGIISFHAGTLAQLRGEFETAIDDYLAECGEDGVAPEKPVPGEIPLRVPAEMERPLSPRGQPARVSIGG